MGAPWTRDGCLCVSMSSTMAPEVAGRIVQLPITDNQFVHKGDSPDGSRPDQLQSSQSVSPRAAAKQAQIVQQNLQLEAKRRLEMNNAAVSVEQKQTYESQAFAAEAQYQQAEANLNQARVNLWRTEIHSPVNGWVTNLLVQFGDYANVGQNLITIVDADSFWIDGYFEETTLGSIHEGDPAEAKLLGYSQVVRGHVDSIARGISSAKRAAEWRWTRLGKSNLHLGAPRPARSRAYQDRSGTGWCTAGVRHDRHRADRSKAETVDAIEPPAERKRVAR